MKNKRYREFELKTKVKILLGKDEESNDELMKEFEGKENTILHTSKPGSPFGVILSLNPSKEEIYDTAVRVAKYCQAWRDEKKDVKIDVFTGKDISKPKGYKKGTWKIKNKSKNAKTIKVKKKDIVKFENKVKENKLK